MASVINPGRRRETSLLDVINTGLNVAQTYAAMKSKSAQEDMAKKQFDVEQQSAADKQAGILSPGEMMDLQAKGYQEAPEGYAGAGIKVPGVREKGGISPPKMLFKAPETEKPSLLPGEGGLYSVTKAGAELVPNSQGLAKKADRPAGPTSYQIAQDKKTEDKDKRRDVVDLRKEFNSNQVTKQTTDLIQAAKKLENVSDSAPGQMALVFSFMKILDPGSTVREGEYANAKNARGIPDGIKNTWNSFIDGEQLTPQQIAEFKSEVQNQVAAQMQTQQEVNDYYAGIAEELGLNADQVINKKMFGMGEKKDETLVLIKDPKGVPRLIPSADVKAAIAAGGTMVDNVAGR